MSVTIEAITGVAKLGVTGDIETVLTVPFDDDDRFLVGLSDGTLLQGVYDEHLGCEWKVAGHGAGIVRIEGRAVTLDWRVEWVTVSIFNGDMIEPTTPPSLPLFPELDRHAA